MRSYTSLAVLASSLLVSEVAAGLMHKHQNVHKRDYYVEVDEVVVTAEVIVTDMGSGVMATGAPNNVGTITIDGTAVLVTSTASVAPTTSAVVIPSSTPAPEAPVVSTSSTEAAVIIEPTSTTSIPIVVSTTPAPIPTTSTTPIVVAPVETTSAALAVEAIPVPSTTLITSAAPVPSTTSTSAIEVPSTTSTSAIAVATTAASSSSTSKRGVAYNDATLTDAFSGMSWAYNWGSSAGGTILSTLEYTPMLWGLDTDDTENWADMVATAKTAGSTHLLAFNEPDYSGQADLTAAEAAAGYLTYMEPYASDFSLVGPAVTNGGDPMGLTWLASFVAACSTCTIDAVAIHWYNGGTIDDFTAYLATAYTAGGNRPLWVTEFQAPTTGTADEQAEFLTAAMAFMDASDMVERYAYFMAADGNLISGTVLSTLGEAYIAVA